MLLLPLVRWASGSSLGLKRAIPQTSFTWNYQSSVLLWFLSVNFLISSIVHLLQALLNLVKFPRAFSFCEFAFLKHLKNNNKNICWSELLPCKSPLAQTRIFFKLKKEYRGRGGSRAGFLRDVKQTSRSLAPNEFIKIFSLFLKPLQKSNTNAYCCCSQMTTLERQQGQKGIVNLIKRLRSWSHSVFPHIMGRGDRNNSRRGP